MTLEAALSTAERLGLPVVLLAAGTFLLWQLGRRLLAALIESYRERITALEGERDHCRARAEAHDDRTNGLCRELIDEIRKQPPKEQPHAGD